MKNFLIIIVMITLITACGEIKEPKIKKSDWINVYNELKKDSVFKKFIGYHIVRRDNENYFMHRNLMIDSSNFEVPFLNANEGTKDYREKELFFEKNPNAKLQFDIMKKLGIKAVLTYNYNPETKRLESSQNVGYNFNLYELTFMISDSISISNINFNYNGYTQIIRENHNVIERLGSNWFVLKRK